MSTRQSFYTVDEVADLFRVSRMTVYRKVQDGEIKAIRFGRAFRIPTGVVDTLLEEGL